MKQKKLVIVVYYIEMISALKRAYPHVHIKAFATVEIFFFTQIYHMTKEETLLNPIDAGLGPLSCEGTEVFSPRVRVKICPEQANTEQWRISHPQRASSPLGLNVPELVRLTKEVGRTPGECDSLYNIVREW